MVKSQETSPGPGCPFGPPGPHVTPALKLYKHPHSFLLSGVKVSSTSMYCSIILPSGLCPSPWALCGDEKGAPGFRFKLWTFWITSGDGVMVGINPHTSSCDWRRDDHKKRLTEWILTFPLVFFFSPKKKVLLFVCFVCVITEGTKMVPQLIPNPSGPCTIFLTRSVPEIWSKGVTFPIYGTKWPAWTCSWADGTILSKEK